MQTLLNLGSVKTLQHGHHYHGCSEDTWVRQHGSCEQRCHGFVIRTYIQKHTHRHAHAYTAQYISSPHCRTIQYGTPRTSIFTYIHTCINAYNHAGRHTYSHTYMHACTNTHMHAYMHEDIHTYIHFYIDPSIHTLHA